MSRIVCPAMAPRETVRVQPELFSSLLLKILISPLINGLIQREISKRFLMSSQREFPIQEW
jgi:hypothetical protein